MSNALVNAIRKWATGVCFVLRLPRRSLGKGGFRTPHSAFGVCFPFRPRSPASSLPVSTFYFRIPTFPQASTITNVTLLP